MMNSKYQTNQFVLNSDPPRVHEMLYNFSNVVRFSFIVQSSLTPLDLALCKSCLRRGENNKDVRSYFNPFPPSPKGIFISTEESCRKYFWKDRRILYRHNLDMSHGIERSLKEDIPEEILEMYGTYFNKLSIAETLDKCVLHSMRTYAYEQSNHKIQFFKLLSKLRKLNDPLIEHFCVKYGRVFLQDLRHKCNDSNVVKAALKMIDFETWRAENEDPELLEDLLFHVRRSNYNLYDGVMYKRDIINDSIIQKKFIDVGPLLKYKDCHQFTSESYRYLKKKLRRHVLGQVIRRAEYYLGRKRSLLLFHIFWAFYHQDHPCASSALRLMWESVPDAYITLGEIIFIFAEIGNSGTVHRIYSFYTKAIGYRPETKSIRSLQHYCRVNIRRALSVKKLWLPDAIKQMGVPTPIEAFLNLERKV